MALIKTADSKLVNRGDRVFDFYDGHWGVVGDIDSSPGSSDPNDYWFTHNRDGNPKA